MAGAKVRFLLKYSLFRGLTFIPRMGCNLNLAPPINANQVLINNTRSISSKSYLAKDRVDSADLGDLKIQDGKKTKSGNDRSDLKRLKELLFQENSEVKESHTNIQNVAELVKPHLKQKKTKSKAKAGSAAVNVTQITGILSHLKPLKDHTPDSESPTHTSEKETQTDHTVEADKFRDALSTLVQDSSIADEIIMAGYQISPDRRSAIEGSYNIKQRQFQDKDKRKKMARTSLKTGPQSHMFDKVREKWSDEHGDVDKSIFQEMAEQEVKDLGMSATVKSGFHDLMDNIHRQWSFPVDNEIYKTGENVGFDEHVFLEHLLDDFPQTGNIQQFMELVVTGLQQNPHLTVQEKKEHVEWFREYFQNIPDEQVQL